MQRCVIYARQSLTREGSESLDSQVEACRAGAQLLGVEVVETLVEPPSTSGYKNRGKDRTKWLTLLRGFREKRWDVVIAYKTDRLSRGGGPGWAPLLEAIEAAGLDVDKAVATPSGYVSEFEIGIRASMDREESKKLSQRITDVSARDAASGKPPHCQRPFGYEMSCTGVREDEAVIFREMVNRVIKGHSYLEVSDWLNSQKILTPLGARWYAASVRKLLERPLYARIRLYKGTEYKGNWTPLLDRETWDQLQLRMKLRREAAQGWAKPKKYLGTGLLVCGKCGAKLTGCSAMEGRGENKKLVRYYRCSKTAESDQFKGCAGIRIAQKPLDHFLAECLFVRLDTPELAKLLSQGQDDGQLKELLSKRTALTERLGGLADDYATGILDKSQMARANAKCRAELLALESEIDALSGQQRLPAFSADVRLRDAWHDSDSQEWRRSLLQLLIKQILVNPSSRRPVYSIGTEAYRFDPLRVQVEWVA